MVVRYKKIKERIVYILHISNVQYRISVSYFLRFRKKKYFLFEKLKLSIIFKNKEIKYNNGRLKPDSD